MNAKIIFLAVCISFCSLYTNSQNTHTEVEDKVLQEKKDYFIKELGLDKEQGEKFWTIYIDFHRKRKKLHGQRKSLLEYYKNHGNLMNEAELNDVVAKYVAMETEEMELKKTFIGNLKTVLPPQKVLKVFMLEAEFKKLLLNRLKEDSKPAKPE